MTPTTTTLTKKTTVRDWEDTQKTLDTGRARKAMDRLEMAFEEAAAAESPRAFWTRVNRARALCAQLAAALPANGTSK
jgi:hypothetical protein